jgi:hypothetical protein
MTINLTNESHQSDTTVSLLSLYDSLSASDKADFTRIINRLLSVTFITKQREDTRRDYYFIERHEALIRQYLKLAGWDLISDRSYEVYQAINIYGYNRLRLKLHESIIILLFRLCYEEKRRELTLSDNVIIRIQELQEKYAALKIRQQPIDKTSLRDTINLLKSFNIVDTLDRNVVDPDCRIIIYPSILFAIKVDDIKNIYDKLQTYSDDKKISSEEGEVYEGAN